jgi:putative tryptophan/tyrosine transport system substrate-binding protein
MRRRHFITLIGGAAAAWPLAARAQQPKIPKVGFLYPGPSSAAAPRIGAFLEGLRAAGYSMPDQLELISRVADGDLTRLSPMAHELVDRNVDVLAAVAAAGANIARAATTTIPIVAMDLETDPVAMIASLAHPGANLTGVFFDFPYFRAKLLELLKEAVPNLSKVAVLWDPNSGPAQLKEFESAADAIKLTLVKLEVRNVAEMNQAFGTAKQADVNAIILLSSPFIGGNTKLAADLALKYGLPAVTLFSEFAVNGGLMSYGPILLDIYRRLGGIAAKVLHGSNPADLPVELPTNFELVVNLKTAKAMGITIPTSILLRADLVIE